LCYFCNYQFEIKLHVIFQNKQETLETQDDDLNGIDDQVEEMIISLDQDHPETEHGESFEAKDETPSKKLIH